MQDHSDFLKYEGLTVKMVKILKCLNPHETSAKKRVFSAICECGEHRTVRQYDIAFRKRLSCKKCGWKRIGFSKLKEGSGLRSCWHLIKKSAAKREIIFDLSVDQVGRITSQDCYYCGLKPSAKTNNVNTKNKINAYLHNGIDRLDSNKGYVIENCVPCCKYCNIAKSTMSVEMFLLFIERVFKFQESKK